MTLKMLSLNLWNGGRLFDQALDFLLTQQADIMFLQEAYDGQAPTGEKRFRTVQLLQQAFPEYDYYFAPVYLDTRQDGQRIEDGQLILSRFSLSETRSVFFDVPYGEYDQDAMTNFQHFPALLQSATILLEDKQVQLLNVHGPVDLDGLADTDRRLKMAEVIVSQITQADQVILAGDFNVQPATKTIRVIERYLRNVFAGELKTTFSSKRKDLTKFPGYETAVVDMMFVSESIEVVSHTCPEVDISDHFPLVAELKL